MSFEPVLASKSIVDKYKRYLSTIFKISDKEYELQFKEELDKEGVFAKGPYLDVTDSFVKGRNINELINDKILTNEFERINMPLTRSLYKHQELSILKANKNKNLVVSTGTGSGKTESFLIPVLNHIIKEYENGTLDPGVRALIIYPMNALANDQMERLRSILCKFPEITYGGYTGQTKNKFEDALNGYKKLNNNENPISNELISREQIKNTPPHILITNYAMLEYLMLRPEDSVFFSEENSYKWKYIILDEAHVYNGSTGIEVSMLLRRLKAKLNNDDIKYILTSATLGNDKDNDSVAEFATNLCDSKFYKDDVIRATRIVPTMKHESSTLNIEIYNEIAYLLENDKNDNLILECINKYGLNTNNDKIEEILYDIVLHDNNYWEIRKALVAPDTVLNVSRKLKWFEQDVVNFVKVASKCEINGDKLFDARYHMFLKATDSVFITLQPNKNLFLNRKEYHYDNGKQYKVFEIGVCSYCHSVYLVGKVETICENNYLVQSSSPFEEGKEIYLLGDKVFDDDDDHSLLDENIEYEPYEICACCGHIIKKNAVKKKRCEHGIDNYVNAFKVIVKNELKRLTKCLKCENINNTGILRMFFTGQEAVTSVIGTALFEELPSYETRNEIIQEIDEFGFDLTDDIIGTYKVNIAKQFIAFSDSRQAAAFYASYLEQTYQNILYKRIIIETIKNNKNKNKNKRLSNFINDLICNFETLKINKENYDADKEAYKAILHELVDNNGNTSLHSMGLLGISINREKLKDNATLGFTANELSDIYSIFVLGMMSDAAITYNANLTKADREYFTYNGIEYSYQFSNSDNKSYIKAFIPKNVNRSNKRLDYLTKILKKSPSTFSEKDILKILERMWNNLIFINLIKNENSKFKVNTNEIVINNDNKWYCCKKCKNVTIHNVRGICPSFKCDGELIPINLDDFFKDNHYYTMYQELDIRELRVVEHTAQLNKEMAYEYQKKFKLKEIDVLSCSTTFEMGVDVGSLETVFMRNMPPSPANYAQRAGRAGRSKQSSAYAITFCNKSSHDFTFFRNPEKMIKGKIDPPKFNVENDKIAIRHVYASALSFFWKQYQKYFSKVFNMLEKDVDGNTGFEIFNSYLSEKPIELKNYINRFLPKNLSQHFGINEFLWIESLMGEEGTFTKALKGYEDEVSILRKAKDDLFKEGKKVDFLTERIKVYTEEEILSFLSRKNVLPKYGFPVDTVELKINDHKGSTKYGLQLQRDLSIAISEYAPDSQIVANGNLITSRYIKKIPNMSWKQFDYVMCENCKTLNIKLHTSGKENILACKQCGKEFTCKTEKFLIPEFGFEAEGDKIVKPGLRKPEKTFRSDIAYVGYREEIQMNNYNFNNSIVEIGISKGDEMAVLNKSKFYVCESCGYTELDDKGYSPFKIKKHNRSSGHECSTVSLSKFSLGYRFETDVLQLRFMKPDLDDWNIALSVLYGVLRGVCSYLNIEQNDISGCLQYFYNNITHRPNYALILYDKTPGGSGHVRRLDNEDTLIEVIKESLSIVELCDCGGVNQDSSCYACLRNYYNQRNHDILKRKYVTSFLKSFLGE